LLGLAASFTIGKQQILNAISFDADACNGCARRIELCPVRAIDLAEGKAKFMVTRCIECGEGVRVYPCGARVARADPPAKMADFQVKVAIPAPTLYAQFERLSRRLREWLLVRGAARGRGMLF
jgi:ferredoxin